MSNNFCFFIDSLTILRRQTSIRSNVAAEIVAVKLVATPFLLVVIVTVPGAMPVKVPVADTVAIVSLQTKEY